LGGGYPNTVKAAGRPMEGITASYRPKCPQNQEGGEVKDKMTRAYNWVKKMKFCLFL
jgi:hypothetical protein